MRPPHFGQDITNTQQNNRNSSGGGNGNDDDESRRQEQIISRLQENGATPVAAMAGKGIIRVVSRCEDAKENSNLGELNDAVSFVISTKNVAQCKSENRKTFFSSVVVVVAAPSINLAEIN